jgi:hypothetical protein
LCQVASATAISTIVRLNKNVTAVAVIAALPDQAAGTLDIKAVKRRGAVSFASRSRTEPGVSSAYERAHAHLLLED